MDLHHLRGHGWWQEFPGELAREIGRLQAERPCGGGVDGHVPSANIAHEHGVRRAFDDGEEQGVLRGQTGLQLPLMTRDPEQQEDGQQPDQPGEDTNTPRVRAEPGAGRGHRGQRPSGPRQTHDDLGALPGEHRTVPCDDGAGGVAQREPESREHVRLRDPRFLQYGGQVEYRCNRSEPRVARSEDPPTRDET